MEIKLTFLGAVRTVTGSMHLIEWAGKRILFDCGLYQGRRKEAFRRNRSIPLDPKSIDALILSHAHIDHSGNIPTIVHQGFSGPIYATPATVDLCDPMLYDSAHIQEHDVRYVNKKRLRQGKKPFEPLYLRSDVDKTMKLFNPVPYLQPFDVAPGMQATFYDAGHILGSAFTSIDFKMDGEVRRVFFTGDMGRKNMPILRDPSQISGADYVVTESTYGDRLHPKAEDVKQVLSELMQHIVRTRGKLIVPAFSVGRTQAIVYFMHELHREGRISPIPIYVDSPLSTKATKVFKKHVECYDERAWRAMMNGNSPFSFDALHYTASVEESKRINSTSGPMIVISASGMCEAGRILHHLANNIEDERNVVLITGFQAQNTLGRRIADGISPVKIFGDMYDVRAKVVRLQALSAHADKADMLEYFKSFRNPPAGFFIVHGEESQSVAFAELLESEGFDGAKVPYPGDSVVLR